MKVLLVCVVVSLALRCVKGGQSYSKKYPPATREDCEHVKALLRLRWPETTDQLGITEDGCQRECSGREVRRGSSGSNSYALCYYGCCYGELSTLWEKMNRPVG
uniref:Uncharacterized protein n=1 Tax=Trichuris muris TaxID=70415 RepID=A0A5S6QJ15_TRIMR